MGLAAAPYAKTLAEAAEEDPDVEVRKLAARALKQVAPAAEPHARAKTELGASMTSLSSSLAPRREAAQAQASQLAAMRSSNFRFTGIGMTLSNTGRELSKSSSAGSLCVARQPSQ